MKGDGDVFGHTVEYFDHVAIVDQDTVSVVRREERRGRRKEREKEGRR